MLQASTQVARPSGAATLQLIILILATAILVIDLALTLRQTDPAASSSSAVEPTVPAQPYIPSIVRPVTPNGAPAGTASPYIPTIVLPVDETGS